MSAKGRPEREHRSAQREGTPPSAKGRPEREHRSAQREGTLTSKTPPRPSSPPCGELHRPSPLTARQQEILDWIRRRLEATGMPPTRAEIAAGLGFRTASSAEDHLRALAKKGAIELLPGTSRGLRLADQPELPGLGLPLVGRVAAGHPILAAEHIEARVRLDPGLFSPRADYLLRVRGDSMKGAGILDGDLLAVHRSAEARSGQIVVARLGGPGGDEVTVKRLKRRGGQVLLVAENPEFAPIVVEGGRDALVIEGIGVGLFRSGKAL